MKQRQARLIGTPSQTRRQQELAEKLEKVKEVLEDEKKRQFDEPLFDLTKLRQALDKAIPQPEDVKGFLHKLLNLHQDMKLFLMRQWVLRTLKNKKL